jgi:hypothetical protein
MIEENNQWDSFSNVLPLVFILMFLLNVIICHNSSCPEYPHTHPISYSYQGTMRDPDADTGGRCLEFYNV